MAAHETGFCDLHLHSTASDGTDAPRDLPRLCQAAGLRGFALTDHDTTAGLAECAEAAAKLGIDFLPGIELSADPDVRKAGRSEGTLHLLGYGIDPQHPQLAAIAQRMVDAREQRNPRIVEKLNALGVRLSYAEVVEFARSVAGGDERAVVGRPHIAQIMVSKGYVKSMHEAFSKYLGAGGAAYTRRDRLAAGEAIEAVHAAGGVVSLAHPVQLKIDDADALEHTLARLVELGLDAIEARHSDHTPADVQRFSRLAERFHLLTTGGSDYHGSRKTVTLGSQRVPYEAFASLREAMVERR